MAAKGNEKEASSVNVTLEGIEVKPFSVPNFVVVPAKASDSEASGASSVPLRDLSATSLRALCDRFREGVFEKAGKSDPLIVTRREPRHPGDSN